MMFGKEKNLGNADEGVHDGLLLDDVVGSLVIVGVLQLVGFFAEQGFPQCGFHLDIRSSKIWANVRPRGVEN